MFSDILVESAPHRRRTGWPAFWSIFLQSSLLALLALLPLLHHDVFVLPSSTPLVPLFAPRETPRPLPEFQHTASTNPLNVLNVASHPAQPVTGHVSADPGPAPLLPYGQFRPSGSIIVGLPIGYSNIGPPPPEIKEAPPKPPAKPSVLMEGNLIHKVQPQYPAFARQIHMQGTVQLRAVIGADGLVHDVQAISGPPPLVQAAMAAVRQWRYRPYVLNGRAIEVESQVTVRFIIND